MSSTRYLLLAGVAAPVLYFGTLFAAAATWPGYSHATQYASELGSANAPYPWLFNAGILAAGLAGVAGALGILLFLVREQRAIAGVAAGLALSAWGVAMLFGGWFPMPDPRHNGFGLMLGVVALPPALMVGLRGRVGSAVYIFLAAWFTVTLALLAIMFGVGSLVSARNVGLWQRALAVAMIPGIGIMCGILAARAGRETAPSRSA